MALEWALGQINTGRQTLENVIYGIETAKAETVYNQLFVASYQALTDVEKQILWAQSIFAGSSTIPSLLFVANLSKDELRAGLEQLVEMSLVYSNNEFEEAKIRYCIHPLLRNFVQRQLSQQHPSVTDELDELTERFVKYFSDYAEKEISLLIEKKRIADRQLEIGVEDISTTMRWAEAEFDNVSNAIDLCYEKNYWEALIKLVKTLSYFYAVKGYWSERIHRGHQAAEAVAKLGNKKTEAWTYINESGYLLIQQGRYEEAEELILKGQEILEREMKVLEEHGKIEEDTRDQQGIQFTTALAKRYLAIISIKQSKYEVAKQFFEQALEIFKCLDRKSVIANQKTEMGELAFRQGEYELAKHYYWESLNYHDKQKDKKPWVYSWMARAYNGLGNIAYHKGNYEKAQKSYQKGLECALQINNQDGIAYSKYGLALISEYRHKYDLALQLAEEAQHILSQVGKIDYIVDIEKMIDRLKSLT